jgi:hypothetical protein
LLSSDPKKPITSEIYREFTSDKSGHKIIEEASNLYLRSFTATGVTINNLNNKENDITILESGRIEYKNKKTIGSKEIPENSYLESNMAKLYFMYKKQPSTKYMTK